MRNSLNIEERIHLKNKTHFTALFCTVEYILFGFIMKIIIALFSGIFTFCVFGNNDIFSVDIHINKLLCNFHIPNATIIAVYNYIKLQL